MAWAGRPMDAPPFAFDRFAPIGNPEAPSVGASGATPPSAGAGAAGAPNLDPYGTTGRAKPSRAPLFGLVWANLEGFRKRVADEVNALAKDHFPRGKNRRGFERKALAIRLCGKAAWVPRCKPCGRLDPARAIIESSCDLRVCPTCARRRANIARTRLDRKWSAGVRPRDMGLYFLTFTLRYDPSSRDDLSVEGLKRRKKIVRDAAGFVWKKYLKPRGQALALGVEVSPRGAVHVHALYHGRRPDVRTLRETYMFRAGDSPIVNCKYVRKPGKAIRELAKYMVKAASAKNLHVLRGGRGEFIDPLLAARVEVAFSGDRLFETMGTWRGAADDSDLPEQAPHICPQCGANAWTREVVPLQPLLFELPDDWVPRFGRAGPRSTHNNRPREGIVT